MSGGKFSYSQYHIQSIAEELETIIENAGSQESNEWGELKYPPWPDDILQEFRNGLKALRIAYVYAQRIDWLLSCDDGEDSFRKRLAQELNQLKGN